MDENSSYLNQDTLTAISNSCSNYMQNVLLNFLYKTSIEFKSDINGFGKYALSDFSTNIDFKNYDWRNSYVNSVFDVNVNTTVNSGFLLNKT